MKHKVEAFSLGDGDAVTAVEGDDKGAAEA